MINFVNMKSKKISILITILALLAVGSYAMSLKYPGSRYDFIAGFGFNKPFRYIKPNPYYHLDEPYSFELCGNAAFLYELEAGEDNLPDIMDGPWCRAMQVCLDSLNINPKKDKNKWQERLDKLCGGTNKNSLVKPSARSWWSLFKLKINQ
jgi:hypothetical protein